MRKLLYIILLLVLVIPAKAAKTKPLYIVDGVFVSHKELPNQENIARYTTLDPEEAVYIYGEKASAGAVLIKTFNHEEYIRQLEEYKNNFDTGVILVFGLAVGFLPYLLLKLISKCKEHLIAEGAIEKNIYSPGPFSDDGIRYQVTSFPQYYISLIILGLCSIGMVGLSIWLLTDPFNDSMSVGLYSICAILITLLPILLVVAMYAIYKTRINHIIIDKKGIRGVYNDGKTMAIMPKFIEFDVTWDKVAKGKITQLSSRYVTIDHLDIFDKAYASAPIISINISMFPTNKIIDAMNYYYALYTGEKVSEDSLLIQPQKLEDNNKLVTILMLGIFGIGIIAMLCIYL